MFQEHGPMSNLDNVKQVIQTVAEYYDAQGIFRQHFGYGVRPALLVIDMAYGWTDPAYATGSSRLDEAVAGICRLLPVARTRSIPIVYTTSPYSPDSAEEPMHIRPGNTGPFRTWDENACRIDERVAPAPDDYVILKDNASGFFGTNLAAYLIERKVDTIIITGCSTSACVRATATDARAYRFRPIVPRQCVQDRSEAAHEWNLFDIDAKFGDVVEVDEVVAYLDNIEPEEQH